MRKLVWATLFLAVIGFASAAAAISLQIINTGTIAVNPNLAFSQVVDVQPDCTTANYAALSPQNVNWGSLNTGPNIRYFCLRNSGNTVASIIGTPDKGTGLVSPGSVGPGQTLMITLTWTIGPQDSGTAGWTLNIA